MKKAQIKLALIFMILVIVTLACVGGGGADGNTNNGAATSNGSLQATQSADATATYGAQQFEIQLTARAQPSSPAP